MICTHSAAALKQDFLLLIVHSLFFFFLITRRMALLTRFLRVSIMLLIQLPKVCVKAAAVSNLAMQTHTHDNIEQHYKHNL